jgi:hypothetical protein
MPRGTGERRRGAIFSAPLLLSALFAWLVATACGGDVDLGGGTTCNACDASDCSKWIPPQTYAKCDGCHGKSCQANGCFNGWYCYTASFDCQIPPVACGTVPDASAFQDN